MRLIKTFGLAALAAVAALAFVGAPSVSANTNTVLCTTHTALVCPEANRVTSGSIHLTNSGIIELLTDLVDVLCLTALMKALPLALGNPQLIHSDELTFSGCGTTSAHDNCVMTVNEQPLYHLLKLGLGGGSLLGLSGKIGVLCEDVFFGIDIDCEYDLTSSLMIVENGHFTSSDAVLTPVPDNEDLCPEISFLDSLLVPLTSLRVGQ